MKAPRAKTLFRVRLTGERGLLLFLVIWVLVNLYFWTYGTEKKISFSTIAIWKQENLDKEESALNLNKASKPSSRLTGSSIVLEKEKSIADVKTEVSTNRDMGFPDLLQMPNPAILVLTYNRADYLGKTLDSLAAVPGFDGYKLYVSQDGRDRRVAELLSEVKNNKLPDLVHLEHKKPLLSGRAPKTEYVASHYGFALKEVFETLNHSHVIVVEDDMLFSSDFLEMFVVTSGLLNEDPTLWCVTSWNDYGLNFLNWKSDRFYRTSRFPGLGWMMTRKVWLEISPKWPPDAWDYFMQTDVIRKGRDCIAPEVSRNHNIGVKGTTMKGSFYNDYLAKVSWNEGAPVSFGDLGYLRRPEFVKERQRLVQKSSFIGRWPDKKNDLMRQWDFTEEGVWLLTIERRSWASLSKKLKLIDSWRTGHEGLIVLRKAKDSIFLIADERECEYLPDSHRKLASPSFTMTPGNVGESCTSTCRATGQVCDRAHFQYVNKCSALAAHFPCEEGCQGGVVGPDIPNYQDNKNKMEFYHRCLTTETTPTCNAEHFSGRRLCPCI